VSRYRRMAAPRYARMSALVGQVGSVGWTSEKADHWIAPLILRQGQAELAGQGGELALVVVLAASGGVHWPTGMGQGVDGLMEHGLEGLAGAFARHSPAMNSSGCHAGFQEGGLSPWCEPWQERTELHAMALALLLTGRNPAVKVHHYL
jgi:hypothetical protein